MVRAVSTVSVTSIVSMVKRGSFGPGRSSWGKSGGAGAEADTRQSGVGVGWNGVVGGWGGAEAGAGASSQHPTPRRPAPQLRRSRLASRAGRCCRHHPHRWAAAAAAVRAAARAGRRCLPPRPRRGGSRRPQSGCPPHRPRPCCLPFLPASSEVPPLCPAPWEGRGGVRCGGGVTWHACACTVLRRGCTLGLARGYTHGAGARGRHRPCQHRRRRRYR